MKKPPEGGFFWHCRFRDYLSRRLRQRCECAVCIEPAAEITRTTVCYLVRKLSWQAPQLLLTALNCART